MHQNYPTEEKEQEPSVDSVANLDWRCTSVEDCEALVCITACLQRWHEVNNTNKPKSILPYLSSTHHDMHIVGAYHHLLERHLCNPNSQTDYKYICQQIAQKLDCNFTTCKCYTRNQRKREAACQMDKDDDKQYIFLRDLLDSIHAYLVHGYVSGHRYVSKGMEIDTALEDAMNGNKEEIKNVFVDAALKNLQKWQRTIKKQQRNLDRSTVFQTTRTTVNKADLYGFGIRLYYWYYYKDSNREDWDDIECPSMNYNPGYQQKYLYVPLTYLSFKKEILAKKISVRLWDQKIYEARTLLCQSETLKKIKVLDKFAYETALANKYGFKENDSIQVTHVLSILFYTNCTTLCTGLRQSFRYLSSTESLQSLVKRNAKWYFLSRYLREAVEVFGERIGHNNSDDRVDKGCFYHGLTDLVFSSSHMHFYGPLSTSQQLEVALLFTNDNSGLIIELKEGGGYYDKALRFFNVGLLSCFSAEDERLFMGGEFPVQISSMRLLKSKINTEPLMHILCIIHKMIQGEYLLNDKINRLDSKIVKKLLSSTNNLPTDVQQIWELFRQKQQNIKIDIAYMHMCYSFFRPLLLSNDPKCKNLLLFNRLVKIFPNTSKIICVSTDNITGDWLDSSSKPAYSSDIVCSSFIAGVRDRLNKIGQHPSSKLTKIIIRTANNEIKEDCKLYATQFAKLGWHIKKESYDGYYLGINKNNQISLTKNASHKA